MKKTVERRKLGVNVSIHNRFDIYVKNVETGEEKQVGYAENIVLDQIYTRLCARSSYFVNIHFGTGTGTLARTRTSLFTHLGTRAAISDGESKVLPTAWWRRRIVLNPEEFVGAALSEVGIAFGATTTNLVTHALIRDMNGNIITLTKTALDVVTIFATVFVTFSTNNEHLRICQFEGVNALVNYLIGDTGFPSIMFYAGDCPHRLLDMGGPIVGQQLGVSSALVLTADVANRQFRTNTFRFGIDVANGHIAEFGIGASLINPVARLSLPAAGVYGGLALAGVPVGTGDGVLNSFVLPSRHINEASIVAKIDGTPTAAVTVSDELVLPFNFQYNQNRNMDTDTPIKLKLSDDGSVGIAMWRPSGVPARILNINAGIVYLPIPFTGNVNDAAISGNGNVIALALAASPFVLVFERQGSGWVQRTQPAVLPTGAANGVDLNFDGTVLGVVHANSPFVTTYRYVDLAYVKQADPAVLPPAAGINCFVSSNGLVLGVGLSATPFMNVYDWTAGAWVRRVNPALSEAGVKMAKGGNFLIQAGNLTVFVWTGSSWTTRTTAEWRAAAAISGDGSIIMGGQAMASGAVVLDWTGTSYVARSIPSIGSMNRAIGTAISADGGVFNFTFQNNAVPGASLMHVFDARKRNKRITFASPPANGAVITADYTVDGIHKTNQRVIDLFAEFTFGEVV